CLVAEPRDRVFVGRDRLHDLDRTGASELRVISAVNDAHRALAYEVLDLVLAQPGSCSDRHGTLIMRWRSPGSSPINQARPRSGGRAFSRGPAAGHLGVRASVQPARRGWT